MEYLTSTSIHLYFLVGISIVVVLMNALRWLHAKAAIATWLMGVAIFFVAGISYLVYPILFVLIGSLASKLNPKSEAEKLGRGIWQVLANGGPSIITLILFSITQNQIYLHLFILSYAVALSDTTSSEFGKRFGTRTIDILGFSPVEKGLSGGISVLGTLMGLAASSLIGFIAAISHHASGSSLFWIILLGFTGMLLDSALGSAFQQKYYANSQITEVGKEENLIKGIHGFDNNWVNFISILLTLMEGFLFLSLT